MSRLRHPTDASVYFFLLADFLAAFAEDLADFAEDFFLTATDFHLRSGLIVGCRWNVIKKALHCIGFSLERKQTAPRENFFRPGPKSILVSYLHVQRRATHTHDGAVPTDQKPASRGGAVAVPAGRF